MKIRLTGLAVLLFTISVHAEISAPPALNPGKNAKKAEDIPVEPSPVAAPSVRPQIQTPIAFENLAVDIEEDPELAPSLASSAASVKSLQEELEHSMLSGDLALSEKIFNKLIRLGAPAEQKRNAMLAMGRYLEEKQNAPTKAAVIYEQFVNLFPNDPEDPDLLLRLGKIYRDNGAFASSLNKFYSVLYSSLQLKNGDAYIDSSLRAKMEIAHTHFAMGDYKTAAQLYSRLKLIDMPQTEASEVTFRAAYIAFLSGDFNTSLNESQRFLSTYPGSPIAPEAQYLIVQSLKSLGRRDDAMRETVKLLQAGREFGRKKPAIWAYWQRKTGNEIANELYESGDAVGALSIYQRLAELDDNPTGADRPFIRLDYVLSASATWIAPAKPTVISLIKFRSQREPTTRMPLLESTSPLSARWPNGDSITWLGWKRPRKTSTLSSTNRFHLRTRTPKPPLRQRLLLCKQPKPLNALLQLLKQFKKPKLLRQVPPRHSNKAIGNFTSE